MCVQLVIFGNGHILVDTGDFNVPVGILSDGPGETSKMSSRTTPLYWTAFQSQTETQ